MVGSHVGCRELLKAFNHRRRRDDNRWACAAYRHSPTFLAPSSVLCDHTAAQRLTADMRQLQLVGISLMRPCAARNRYLPLILFACAGLIGVAGCGDDTPTAPTPTPTPMPTPAPTVTSVAVTGDTIVGMGQTVQLTATATFSNGTQQNVTSQATWQSSNSSLATVSAGLVVGLTIGSVAVTASFQGASGALGITVTARRFAVRLDLTSFFAVDTCDDGTQGPTIGEFTMKASLILPDGTQPLIYQTDAYPGDPSGPRVFNLGRGASQPLTSNITRTLAGEAGQFVQVEFRSTEWDEQVVMIPPFIRYIHDSRMRDLFTTRTHSFSGGTFTGLGANTLTLGSGSCQVRLNYSVTAQ